MLQPFYAHDNTNVTMYQRLSRKKHFYYGLLTHFHTLTLITGMLSLNNLGTSLFGADITCSSCIVPISYFLFQSFIIIIQKTIQL